MYQLNFRILQSYWKYPFNLPAGKPATYPLSTVPLAATYFSLNFRLPPCRLQNHSSPPCQLPTLRRIYIYIYIIIVFRVFTDDPSLERLRVGKHTRYTDNKLCFDWIQRSGRGAWDDKNFPKMNRTNTASVSIENWIWSLRLKMKFKNYCNVLDHVPRPWMS